MKTWRLARSNARKIVGTAVAALVMGLAPAGLSVAKAAADRLQLSMMDDDKDADEPRLVQVQQHGQYGSAWWPAAEYG